MFQALPIAAPARKRRVALVTTLLLAWMVLSSGLARAQSAPPASVPLTDTATEVLPKTITYGVMAAAIDVAIGSFITGGVVAGTAMAVVASTSNWLLYQAHEMAWASAGPTDQPLTTKTATFAVANTLRLFGVGLLFTQDVALSATFVVLDALAEGGAYVVTDRVWTYVVQPLVSTAPSGHKV